MITYCTNIHPGESWGEIFSNIKTHVIAVRNAVSPNEPFPVGLRLSNRAAREMNNDVSQRFQDWLEEKGCYIPTINGFPYASFHRPGLKEGVYLPDWRSEERAVYTMLLTDLLASWLPEGMRGSISTVPVGFRTRIGREDYPAVRRNLLDVLEHIDRLRQKKGRDIVLSLEPEPGCVIETTADAVSFLERMDFPEGLRTGAGICLDLCHLAVEFEAPSGSLEMLSQAEIRIGKVQVSSGLRFLHSEIDSLGDFVEPRYLHQVVIRDGDGVLTRYNDIPEAVRLHSARAGEEWRVHFHVPIYAERTQACGTTNFFIEEALPLFSRDVLLEIETYTWRILPAGLQAGTVDESIIREIEWLKART
ncbi:MAG: xylose isomerase [Syntrophobacterales bacterium GWC2_56_13]|nr:MAG: xylose isomerase [Syntrophobacterales bacterium GWC2_56_13]